MNLRNVRQIGEGIHNAYVFDIKHWRKDWMNSDSLIKDVQDLFVTMEERQVDYVLVGGVAFLHYVEGRNTQDLDLLMALSSLKKIPELKISSLELYFARASYRELQIDILLTKNPFFKKIYKKHSKYEHFLDRDIPIVTVDGLILLKLYALPSLYRQGNFAKVGIHENDIATLIYYYQPDVDGLLDEMSGYIDTSDFAEIRNILTEIKNRISRFRNELR